LKQVFRAVCPRPRIVECLGPCCRYGTRAPEPSGARFFALGGAVIIEPTWAAFDIWLWQYQPLNTLNLLGVALGLAMDAFAVAIVAGLTLAAVTPRHVFRLAFHFGLFQFLMPVLGWFVGRWLASYVATYDHWLAFALLSYVGGKMLVEAFRGEEPGSRLDPTRGLLLVTLSVATSIDALAVGLSMAFLHLSVWGPAIVIGMVAAGLTAIGVAFGNRLGQRIGRWAEAGGGCVLLLIGARILVMHLTARPVDAVSLIGSPLWSQGLSVFG